MNITPADYAFMAQALRLAERGLFTTTPNPRVGCVIVRDGKVVGQGFHQRAGEPHAEIYALREAGTLARGATAYVSLEPCSHHGRTPPCVNALSEAKLVRVVAATQDPNPQVSGDGLRALQGAGIAVEVGVLEAEAREINIGFVSRMTRGRPWVRTKVAASLDGKTALNNGISQWITGPEARRDGHFFRARACAILTGIGTVLADNPQLNVRDVKTSRQPLRIVVDNSLELKPSAKIMSGGRVVVVTVQNDPDRAHQLEGGGAEIIMAEKTINGRVDLKKLMQELGRREINEVHVEAGAKLNGALLQAGLVDEIVFYLAPCLLGSDAKDMFNFLELTELKDKYELKINDVRTIGKDLRIVARFAP